MIKLAIKSLLNRKGVVLLLYISLSFSVFLFIGVERTKEISRKSFSRTISGTDLIIGARTGQVNLILYSVFHMGYAVNNMDYSSFKELSEKDEVKWSIPLSLGDTHRSYRVIGTTELYFKNYSFGNKQNLKFTEGKSFETPFELVLGSAVASSLSYSLGEKIVINHGAGSNTLHKHDTLPFTVSGILEKTGTPIDKSLFIPLEGMTAIHIGWEQGFQTRELNHQQALRYDLSPKEITAALFQLKNKRNTFRFQREVNNFEDEALMAILPGAALYELWSLMSVAEKALVYISGAVVLIGLISLLSSQLAVIDQRRREMALFRSLGATPTKLFFMLFLESFFLSVAGIISGLILLYLAQLVSMNFLKESGLYLELTWPSKRESWLLLITLVSGLIIGLIPGFVVYKKSLTDGLSVRS